MKIAPSRTSRILFVAILGVLSGFGSTITAQVSLDELGDFFAAERPQPAAAAAKEMEVLWRLIQIGNRQERQESRRKFLKFGREGLLFLEAELERKNADERRAAALILARLADPSAAAKFRQLLFQADKKDRTAFRHLVMGLGILGGPEDAKGLVALLRARKSKPERRAILYAIARLAAKDQIMGRSPEWRHALSTELAPFFGREKAQGFRSALLLALGYCGGPAAKKVVMSARRDRRVRMRRMAAISLFSLYRQGEVELSVISKMLGDADEEVVHYALLALAKVTSKEVSGGIKSRALQRHADDAVRGAALMALGVQNDSRSHKLLARRVKPGIERDREVRQKLAFALARAEDPHCARGLLLLQGDDKEEVAAAAICAGLLRKQGLPVLVLEKFVQDSRRPDLVRELSLEALCYLGTMRRSQLLAKVIEDSSFKAPLKELAKELQEILKLTPTMARERLRARLQVRLDDFGGSPEWNFLNAIAQEIRRNESVDRPLGNRGTGTRPGPGGVVRPPQIWTKDEEDFRMWYDSFPYFALRQRHDIP